MSQFQFYVTILVPLVSPRIQSCTPRPSTFQLSFTFFGNRSLKRISSWNVSGQKNRLQMFSLSLSQERPLSTSKKNWESYYLLIELIHLQQHISMTGGTWQKYPLPLMPKGEKNLNKEGKGSIIVRGSFVDKGRSFEGGAFESSSMTKGEIVD